jgi:hypothetical protein
VLPSPRFLRSSTRRVTRAAAVARRLAAGGRAAISLREAASPPGNREICFGEGRQRSVRLAYAQPGPAEDDREASYEVLVPSVLSGEGGELCLPFAPPEFGPHTRLAWVAEDLDNETWTGGVESRPSPQD